MNEGASLEDKSQDSLSAATMGKHMDNTWLIEQALHTLVLM